MTAGGGDPRDLPMPDTRRPQDNHRQGYRYMGLGLEFAAAVAGLSLLGYWVDRHYGTGPWGLLIGALVGLIGGLNNFIKGGLAAARDAARKDVDRGDEGAGKEGGPQGDDEP